MSIRALALCLATLPLAVAQADERSSGTASSDDVDNLTLLYINHHVFGDMTVECRPKSIEGRSMVGCRGISLDGGTNVQVWEFADQQFWSINGSARTVAEGKLRNESIIKVSPLPLPSDIDVGEVVDAFRH